MKCFLVLLLSWYAQDLLQIVMTQTFLAPEIYALALICCATVEYEPRMPLRWMAAAVVGGLLFDLRWVGIPGLSSALYLCALFAARKLWFQVPAPNRRLLPFVVIAGGSVLLITPFRLFFWDVSVLYGRITTIIAAQWSISAVALLLIAVARPYANEEL